ncbi:MAG TPA: SdrD B-like domain-containing protein, partial [Pirellulales bacterium]
MWGFFPRSVVLSSLVKFGRPKSRRQGKRRGRHARIAERLETRRLLSSDPIVTVDSNFGDFQIELRPDVAPQTVANFLQYVESGAYTNTIFHRSVPGFVEQTGGYTSSSSTFTSTSQFTTIPANAAIPLEYDLPNIAGSVAMARTSDENSATDEWFVNLADNSTQLGPGGSDQYGYAVFGQVLGNGMQVLNAIAALPVDNADNAAFSQLPVGANNELAVISSITIDSIDGTVFSDTNGNGTLDAGEQGVAGRTLFVDLAGTGVYQSGDPTATTDATGNFSFSGITPGTYKVYEELPSNVSLEMPSQTVTVAADETASGVNFAEQPSIKGVVFNDTNANGTLDSGETGVAGATVFLNNDGTGAPDASNPSTVTDSNGNYSFSLLAPGNYKVAVVPPTGTTISTTNLAVTVTAGGAVQTVNIGEVPPSIAGTVFTDVNDNGTFDTGDVGIAGRTVFIDQDGSGKADGANPQTTTDSVGNFTFSGLAAGSYTVDEVLPSGGTLTTPAQTVTVTTGQTTSGVVFGELPSISGTVFADLNGNGTMDTGEPGLAAQTVFLNIDGSGKPDSSNPSTTTDASGKFAFGTEPAGSYTVEEVLPDNVTLSTPAQTVTANAGSTASGVLFGELPSITGTVFTDTNGNGVLDSGETGVAGQTVFLDIDGSGAPDSSNPSTTTDANGNYDFLGLAPGNYPVTEVVPSGVTLTTKLQTVTVAAGQTASGVNIGQGTSSTSTSNGASTSAGSGTGSISGVVFDDYNLNGQLDSGEPGVGGQVVFLDIDGSGAPDSGNPSTTTDGNGNFSFTGLAAGTYAVDEVIPLAGAVTITTSPVSITLTAGQNATGANIGDAVATAVVPVAVSTVAPPAASAPDAAYINALYLDILGHAPDADSLTYWQQQLASGTSRDSVAGDIWDSTEHRTAQVEQFYHDFLGRAADAAGLQFWIDSFNSWGNEQFDAADFFGSPEFQGIHSNSPTDLVDALYSDVELRPGNASDESDAAGEIASGANMTQDWYNVIYGFIYGQEASTDITNSLYAAFLRRAPDSADLQAAVSGLDSRAENADQLAISLLSSDEFYNDVTGNAAAQITSAADTAFTEGTAGTFTVTTSGLPVGTITESGTLPGGVTFTDNGDGTATLAGTPAVGSSGKYDLTLSVENGVGAAATQSFELSVLASPAFTSADSASMTEGTAGTFTITTTGTPAAVLSQTGSLPTGVTFVNNNDGTATLSGTPTAGSAGTYDLTVNATNGIGSSATQNLTLTVNAASSPAAAPAFTSADSASLTAGTGGTFTINASGSPTPTITEAATDTPVTGVSLGASAAGSAILTVGSTTPAGTYTLNFNADNGDGEAATQAFTLVVGAAAAAPAFTSADGASFTAGTGGTFTINASGSPTPTITEAATDTPVAGVSLGASAAGSAILTVDSTTPAGTYTLNFNADNGDGEAAT